MEQLAARHNPKIARAVVPDARQSRMANLFDRPTPIRKMKHDPIVTDGDALVVIPNRIQR